jgi:hypothetical protein
MGKKLLSHWLIEQCFNLERSATPRTDPLASIRLLIRSGVNRCAGTKQNLKSSLIHCFSNINTSKSPYTYHTAQLTVTLVWYFHRQKDDNKEEAHTINTRKFPDLVLSGFLLIDV